MARKSDAPADKAVQDAIRTQVRAMRAQVDRLRTEDPDGTHDTRVATRRLRAILAAHAKMFPKPALRGFRERIRQVTAGLGKPRELDVTLALLQRHHKDLHGAPRYAINHVIRRVRAQRAAQSPAIAQCVAAVASPEFGEELARLLDGAKQDKGYRRSAIRNTTGRYKELVDGYALWRKRRTVAELHILRITFKKFRYTCEMYGGLYGREMNELVDRLRDAQEHLGDWHDYCILKDCIEHAAVGAPPKAAQGMSELLRTVDDHIEALLGQFAARAKQSFKKSRRKKIVAFLNSPPKKPRRDRPKGK